MAKEKKNAEETAPPGVIDLWTQRAKGIGLLAGFAVAFLVSYRAGLPWADATIRGVIGGLVMSVVAWWCSLMVIQGLIRTAMVNARLERDRAAAEAAAAAESVAAAGTVSPADDLGLPR
ncbi:MAG: hypothetical protein KDC33_02130 [Thermoleophilia bacterium]|nr:hypothetical protein [Thermoleophilia bacterium]